MVVLGEVCVLIEVEPTLSDLEARRVEAMIESETRDFAALLERYILEQIGYVVRLSIDLG